MNPWADLGLRTRLFFTRPVSHSWRFITAHTVLCPVSWALEKVGVIWASPAPSLLAV